MKTIVFCLEEPSAREMMEGVLPRILPDDIEFRFIVFQGKQDFEKQLVRRLRLWRTSDTCFVVMRDQDAADCRNVKSKLVGLCRKAGRKETITTMQFRIADTFTDSLARLTNEEQKAVKTSAFDLQMNPTNPGPKFHKLERVKDPKAGLAPAT